MSLLIQISATSRALRNEMKTNTLSNIEIVFNDQDLLTRLPSSEFFMG